MELNSSHETSRPLPYGIVNHRRKINGVQKFPIRMQGEKQIDHIIGTRLGKIERSSTGGRRGPAVVVAWPVPLACWSCCSCRMCRSRRMLDLSKPKPLPPPHGGKIFFTSWVS
ncbi:unnamed protein product [Urochloa humidicola]